jgi:hypothetical protein
MMIAVGSSGKLPRPAAEKPVLLNTNPGFQEKCQKDVRASEANFQEPFNNRGRITGQGDDCDDSDGDKLVG